MLSTSICASYFNIHVSSRFNILLGFSTLFSRLKISLIFFIYFFTTYVSSRLNIVISSEWTSFLVRKYLEALER